MNKTDKYVPDCIFPSDNEAEIPSLRLDVQPKACEIPFVCFGEQKRTFQMNGTGTLHFYTDDYRFNAVYEHPEKILQHNPANIVEPNFSLFNEMPVSFGMQTGVILPHLWNILMTALDMERMRDTQRC